MKYRAYYRRIGITPILRRYPGQAFYLIESYELPEDISIEQIKEFAKENTPEEYIFTEVVPVK